MIGNAVWFTDGAIGDDEADREQHQPGADPEPAVRWEPRGHSTLVGTSGIRHVGEWIITTR